MKIGVYVGSFDPVHIGHIKVMDYLIENKYVDKIIMMATYDYWEKKTKANIGARVNMLKLLNRNYLIVDDKNNKYKYTFQILEKLNEIYNDDELFLIISADNIVSFNKWMNVEDILKNNKVIVMNRNNIDIKRYVDKFKQKDRFIIVQDYPFIDISSTKLRNKIDKNYLEESVYNYIIDNNLYGGE